MALSGIYVAISLDVSHPSAGIPGFADLVEKLPAVIRRGRRRRVYCLTPDALRSFDTGTGSFDIVMEGFEDLEPDLDDLNDLISSE